MPWPHHIQHPTYMDGCDLCLGRSERVDPLPREEERRPEPEQPLLGLATTKQMLLELECRFMISTKDAIAARTMNDLLTFLSPEYLDYRTVDHD